MAVSGLQVLRGRHAAAIEMKEHWNQLRLPSKERFDLQSYFGDGVPGNAKSRGVPGNPEARAWLISKEIFQPSVSE